MTREDYGWGAGTGLVFRNHTRLDNTRRGAHLPNPKALV